MDRGETVDWIDGVEVSLKAGELCIHNPNTIHKILRMDPQTSPVINVLLPVELFQRVFYSWLLVNDGLDAHLLTDDVAIVIFRYHTECVRAETGEPYGIEGLETQVLRLVDGAWKISHIQYHGKTI